MRDPRIEVIADRFRGIRKVIAVSSGKGGVGKSIVATTLALTLAKTGAKVGLLDLDFTSPSTHVILGVEGLHPKEERGIIPPVVHNLSYMSIVYYSVDEPVPLRGADVSNALIELLAVTRWGELDYLMIDMPPGIGDATLDLLRLIPRISFLVVTTPSRVAFESVRKLLLLLRETGTPVLGVVENMATKPSDYICGKVEGLNFRYLGSLGFDAEIEDAIGDPERLMATGFAEDIWALSKKIPD
jgi:ATP-binding protein involved in chromosome partitioning